MRGRAFRRHQLARVKKKVSRIISNIWNLYENNGVGREMTPKEQINPTVVGKYTSTHLVLCSSLRCCGNPRRKKGMKNLTKQEKIAELKLIETSPH
jgi:hypothetical protein